MDRSAQEQPGLYFFLSYAGSTKATENGYVQRLFDDLSAEVSAHASDQRTPEVGFLDRLSLQAGDVWSPALVGALAHCQTLVCLCNPNYFISDACGREWTVFQRRLAEYRQIHRQESPALIPLIWVPMKNVPPIMAGTQYKDSRFGEVYARDGVRALLRQPRHHHEYLDFVGALARRIIEVAEEHPPLPPARDVPDFYEIPDAFAAARKAAPKAAAPHVRPSPEESVENGLPVTAVPAPQPVPADRLATDDAPAVRRPRPILNPNPDGGSAPPPSRPASALLTAFGVPLPGLGRPGGVA